MTTTPDTTATPKQVAFALHLMDEAGYPTDWMYAGHKALGASMRERSGSVSGWLAAMSRPEISRLIKRLQGEAKTTA